MSTTDSFPRLLERLRAGDHDAAAEVFNRYAQRLISLARARLDSQIRKKVDPEDVIQSAFRTFFTRAADGRYLIENWESLWSLLVVITLRKCGRQIRYFRSPSHDVERETCPWLNAEGEAETWEQIARGEPTPSEIAVFNETVIQVMSCLDDRDRRILTLRLQGCTAREISMEVSYTAYTIQAVLKRIRKRLKHMRDAEVTP